ncbi:cupin [Dyadobacter psychrotolerans]|uniref:Cupin n=1 Tax=Dyadobacter psychrotolerans TaxID=2541721 RepID=A0A4R5DUL3_9BACT|nr:cupin [Dyadobacter psychrotolerans]TDE17467.1 cupin [Dyadobacter psychrotolerans]
MTPELHHFEDDGIIPNNKLPLLIYRHAFSARKEEGALWLEKRFAGQNWSNFWLNGIYNYHHYHSITHEVLGVYAGSASVQFGGESGTIITIDAGDIIIIPAGVGHKNIFSSEDFAVAGAYPEGHSYDVLKGEAGERPFADQRIAAVPIPESDPLLGKNKGLSKIWS